jgi:hypothetical protein
VDEPCLIWYRQEYKPPRVPDTLLIFGVKMYAELARMCRICGLTKPNKDFHLNGARRKDGTSAPRTDCKDCSTEVHRQYVAKKRSRINARRKFNYQNDVRGIKTKMSDYSVRKLYKITAEEYQRMFDKQGGVCRICKIKRKDVSRRFDVDHDHNTGKIRGLLCLNCNRGIGLLKESATFLRRAARYLDKSKK